MIHDDILSRELAGDEEACRLFCQENFILEVTELLCEAMEENDVSRSNLASRLGTTKGYITQILRGNANLTLRKVSDVLFALKKKLSVALLPIDASSAVLERSEKTGHETVDKTDRRLHPGRGVHSSRFGVDV